MTRKKIYTFTKEELEDFLEMFSEFAQSNFEKDGMYLSTACANATNQAIKQLEKNERAARGQWPMRTN